MKPSALFDRIGPDALRAVLTDFYRRVFGDVMIGFMFRGKDRQHLIDREYELTAALLGAPGVAYTGRPMRVAHAQHAIFGGQFERRLQILRETLRDHGSECNDTAAAGPKLAVVAPADPDRPIKLGRR